MSLASGSIDRLKVGVMLDSTALNLWQAEALRHLEDAGDGVVSLVIIGSGRGSRATARGGRERRSTSGADRLLDLFATHVSRAAALQPHRPPWSAEVPKINLGGTDPAVALREVTEAVSADRIDVLLHLGASDASWALASAPRFGVWSFEHGMHARAHGEPVGFHELVSRKPVVRAVLRRLDDQGKGGVSLRHGWFATAPTSLAVTRDRVLLGSSGWPAQVLRLIRSGLDPADGDAVAMPTVGHAAAGVTSLTKLLSILTTARIRRMWHHGLRHDDWNIGVIDAPIGSLLDGPGIHDVDWAPTREGHYAADPFGRSVGVDVEVAYEDYSHAEGRASIVRRLWSRSDGWRPPHPMLHIGTHLSYPFLFEHQVRLLMLPESQASGSLTLYEQGPEGEWHRYADLDVPGEIADATPVEHAGRWWLFASRANHLNPATELMLWYAERPEGPWTEHPRNPVITDARSARPGGRCFVVDGQLYRPAQDCSTGYGDRLAIRRVLTLTTEDFLEETVRVVQPEADGPFPFGLHTLNAVGEVTLVDGKRRVRHTTATLRAIRRRLHL